jgi:hypothetical protein
MKAITLLIVFLEIALSAASGRVSLEDLSPHLSTNAPVIWAATTNWNGKMWKYERVLPHVFSSSVISNAIVLASLQKKGFPKPSTNDFFIPEEHPPNYPGAIAVIFSIEPKDAILSYFCLHPNTNSTELPDDDTLLKQARACAVQLGIDLKQVASGKPSSIFNSDADGNLFTNQVCGRRIFLARQLDGIPFYDHGDAGWNEGFNFELGSGGQIRSFFVDWPELRRNVGGPLASVEQIIALIRAHRVIVLPNGNEEGFFRRVKSLANSKKFTIVKFNPYYMDGELGETNYDYVPPKFASPFAELEAVAELPDTNINVRIFCPILSSDVSEWLKK